MRVRRITGVVAALALTTALSGCVVDDDVQPGAEGRTTSTEAAPAKDTPTKESKPEKSEDAKDYPNSADTAKPKKSSPISLMDDDEGTLYLRPIQAFSPMLESWVVDTDAGRAHYTRYTCLGTVKAEGTGSMERIEGTERSWTITWDGESPMRLEDSPTTRVTITDTTLTSTPDEATADTKAQLRQFAGMCGDAGETAAGFLLS